MQKKIPIFWFKFFSYLVMEDPPHHHHHHHRHTHTYTHTDTHSPPRHTFHPPLPTHIHTHTHTYKDLHTQINSHTHLSVVPQSVVHVVHVFRVVHVWYMFFETRIKFVFCTRCVRDILVLDSIAVRYVYYILIGCLLIPP